MKPNIEKKRLIWSIVNEHAGAVINTHTLAALAGMTIGTTNDYLRKLKDEHAITWETVTGGRIFEILQDCPDDSSLDWCPICRCTNGEAITCALCTIHVGPGHAEQLLVGDICKGCYDDGYKLLRRAA